MIHTWWQMGLASLAVCAAVMAITALAARRARRVSVVDVAWGLAFVAVALLGLLGDGAAWRRVLLALLVAGWGGRLASHIARRARGHGEDPRYRELLGGEVTEPGVFATAVRKVFLVQGVAVWLISLPLQVGAVFPVAWSGLVWVGVLVVAAGVAFEGVGDAQLAAYKRDPERPRIMDRGLWGWTRHPNYFGDALTWWGFWLIGGLSSGWLPGLLTVVAPAVMTHFLRNVTGAKLLEKSMSSRPGWAEYAARVPLFFPRPPRRG